MTANLSFKSFRILVVLLVMLALTLVAAQDEPTEITVFRGGVTIDWDNDPVILELERQANVDVKFVTSGWGDIGQVRNLALASEEDIDIYHHMDLSPQWIEDEVIIALDDYINADEHPYLYNLVHSDRYSSMKRDGKVYYIPMVAEGFDWVFLVRQDWMDELGMDYPANEVEFRELLQAFKDRDPDGRTVGWQLEGTGGGFRRTMLPVFTAFGVPTSFFDQEKNFYIGDDGVLAPIVTSSNIKAALQYMNGLYADGLVNTDFPTIKSFPDLSERYIQAGKAGLSWFPNSGNFPIPNAELGFLPPFTASGFEFTRSEGVVNNGWISVSAVSDTPQEAVDFLEFLNSREARKLLSAGIEGFHYSSFDENGNFERIEENWTYESTYYPLWFYFGQGGARGVIPIAEYDSLDEAFANVEIWEPTVGGGLRDTLVASALWTGDSMPFQFVEFPELNDIKVALGEALLTGWTEMITADPANFEAEWQEFLDEWQAAGGDEWVAAYQAYYDEHMG